MVPRLPMDASSSAEVHQYIQTRARQLQHAGFRWLREVQLVAGGAYRTLFLKGESAFAAYYIPVQVRGGGLFRRLLEQEELPIVTTQHCGIEAYLQKVGHPYICAAPLLDTPEYGLISEFYGDGRAERSQALLMNHIDEGLTVLTWIGASELAIRAYCLHPLVQGDSELAANLPRLSRVLAAVPDGIQTLALALEYRKTAMAYLSRHSHPAGGIQLSPLEEVNQMLIADKVQNRKDFERFHLSSHPRSARLSEYFMQWLARLGVSEPQYAGWAARLPDY